MQYYSLLNKNITANFKQATITGQASDKGLFFPQYIPKLDLSFINNIENYTSAEIAFTILQPYVGNSISNSDLHDIIIDAFNFETPLVQINDSIFSLELYHGPTLAFKDFGARFMSRCLGHFVKNENKKVTVLVATSGDTGGAVANGFYNVPGVDVIILYPSGKVSNVQEKQLTTLGNNITALEVNGSFDDCQAMVKEAFMDQDLKEKYFLTSANSINVARWLPQQLYYFLAYQQLKDKSIAPIFSVPSGNFGNIAAGVLAHLSGLPVQHFIAACNANDVVPNYMSTQNYKPQPTIPTISNAMDVGNPSNFTRVLALFNNEFEILKNKFSAFSIDDVATSNTLKYVYENYDYLCDTHGAVAYTALKNYLETQPINTKGIFLETAHPIKFNNVIEPTIKQPIAIPESIANLINKEKKSISLNNSYADLKAYLLQ